MLATAPACTGCQTMLGSAAQPVRLLDLTFHKLCAPQCQSCGQRLGGADESRWRYSSPASGDRRNDRFEPSAFWCPPCWAMSVQTVSAR